MKMFFNFLLLITVAAAGSAQITWERLPGPDGRYNIQCVSVDASTGAIWVGTASGGGIFNSTDQGLTWNNRSSGLSTNTNVTDIAVSGGTVVAAVGNEIFRSTDYGVSWTQVAGAPGAITNLHVTSGGDIYAGSELSAGGSGIHKSTDGGSTWTLSASGIPTYVIFFTYYRSVSAITSDGAGNLYCSVNSGNASTEAGVYASTDGGASWTRTSSGLHSNVSVKAVSSSPTGRLYVGVQHKVYSSTDNGANWIAGDSLPVPTSSITNAFAYNTSGGVFVATNSGLYKGAAGGTGWTRLGSPPLPGNVADVYVNSGLVIAGGLDIWGYAGGCFRSIDGGIGWEESNDGMNNGFVNALTVAPWGHIYSALGRGRLEYSADGGVSFNRVIIPYTGSSTFATITDIEGNANGALVAGAGDGIYASTDSGATWTKTSTTAVKTLGVDASQYFYAATASGVLRSTDGGQNWSGLGGGGNSNTVFRTASGTILSGTYNNGIERTTDGGTSWTNSGTGLFGNITIGFFVQVPGGTIYTHTLGGIFRSTDDGASWAAVPGTPVGEQYRVLAATGGTLMIGTTLGGVYVSTDGATTWQQSTDGMLNVTVTHISVAPDGRLYESGGVSIYRTQDPVLTDVVMTTPAVPSEYTLSRNYPNPFNPMTTVKFTLPVRSEVTVSVFNTLGERVATLADGSFEAGGYEATWDAAGMPSGAYFCTIRATASAGKNDGYTGVRRMLLVK